MKADQHLAPNMLSFSFGHAKTVQWRQSSTRLVTILANEIHRLGQEGHHAKAEFCCQRSGTAVVGGQAGACLAITHCQYEETPVEDSEPSS